MVPASHPGRLLNEFSMFPTTPLIYRCYLMPMIMMSTILMYCHRSTEPTIQYPPLTFPPTTSVQSVSFGHLLNFFSSTPGRSATPRVPGYRRFSNI